MALLVSVALFGLLATVITAYGYGRYAKPARLLQQLDPEPAADYLAARRIGDRKGSIVFRRGIHQLAVRGHSDAFRLLAGLHRFGQFARCNINEARSEERRV